MKEQLLGLFQYAEWVNQRLLKSAALLSQEEFQRNVLSGFGSVHLTCAHLLGAERLWFERWQGRSPRAITDAQAVPSLGILNERWAELVSERSEYLARMEEVDFAARLHWTNMRGQSFSLPRWQVMLHCVNHSTHHHAEVAAMLSALGREPESTDLLEFYLAHDGQSWKPTQIK